MSTAMLEKPGRPAQKSENRGPIHPGFPGIVMPGCLYIVRLSVPVVTASGIVIPGAADLESKNRNTDRLDWGFLIAGGEYRTRQGLADPKEAKELGFPAPWGSLIQYHHPRPYDVVEERLFMVYTHEVKRILPPNSKIPNGPTNERYDWLHVAKLHGYEPLTSKE